MEKKMHCGAVHLLPEDLCVAGAIAFDKEIGFFSFYRVIATPIEEIVQGLMKAGVKREEIILFEGFKDQLIAIVKPLNDEIRARQAPENHSLSPLEELPCPAAT